MPPQNWPLDGPLRQERSGKHKGEPTLKRARSASASTQLVSESHTEESESEMGGIASRVRESSPYYQHVSLGRERAQRERQRRSRRRHKFKKGVPMTRIVSRPDTQVQEDKGGRG